MEAGVCYSGEEGLVFGVDFERVLVARCLGGGVGLEFLLLFFYLFESDGGLDLSVGL